MQYLYLCFSSRLQRVQSWNFKPRKNSTSIDLKLSHTGTKCLDLMTWKRHHHVTTRIWHCFSQLPGLSSWHSAAGKPNTTPVEYWKEPKNPAPKGPNLRCFLPQTLHLGNGRSLFRLLMVRLEVWKIADPMVAEKSCEHFDASAAASLTLSPCHALALHTRQL